MYASSSRMSPVEVINRRSTTCRYCSTFLRAGVEVDPAKPWNRILAESPNFVVVPTLGALLEGWLLVVPRRHILCVGALPQSLFDELESLLEEQVAILGSLYQEPTIFEHGPARNTSPSGCGIYHAHLHIAPLNFSLTGALADENPGLATQAQVLETIQQTRAFFENQSDYLLIIEPNSKPVAYSRAAFQSQFLRMVIAKKLGVEDKYDYNQFSFARHVKRTVASLEGTALVTQ